MWNLIAFVVSGISLLCDHMAGKEEEKEQEKRDLEIQELKQRVRMLEQKEANK